MHRYGRHGAKAWLHSRNKRFRKTYLALSPRVAVLNVPLEFLSRIQKIVIFMQDGSRLEVENNVSQAQLNGQPTLSADERFLDYASDLGIHRAEKDYPKLTDPYMLDDLSEIEEEAYKLHRSMKAYGDQFTTWSTKEEAVADYLVRFNASRLKRLDEISGATTKGGRKLIVTATKDRDKDGNSSSEHIHQIRAIIRGYQSLTIDEYISEELSDEEILRIEKRTILYHNRHGQHRSSNGNDPKEVD